MGEHTDLRAAYMEDVANLLAEVERLRYANQRLTENLRSAVQKAAQFGRLPEDAFAEWDALKLWGYPPDGTTDG